MGAENKSNPNEKSPSTKQQQASEPGRSINTDPERRESGDKPQTEPVTAKKPGAL